MARFLPRVVVTALLLLGGLFGFRWYEENTSEAKHQAALKEKDQVIAAERQKNEVLRGILKRLQTDRRTARMIVSDQQVDAAGQVTSTTVKFSEYDRTGAKLLEETTKDFTVEGDTIYVAACVIEFEDAYVEQNDPARGHSVAVFQRVFGKRGPDSGYELRSAADGPDAAATPAEKQVWKDFWRLSDDAALRKEFGVKRAVGKAVFSQQFKPGFQYTVTLDPRGNLSMDTAPLDPLVSEMLKEKRAAAAATRPAK